MRPPRLSLALGLVCLVAACEAPVTAPDTKAAPSFSLQPGAGTVGDLTLLASGGDLQSFVDNANEALVASGAPVMIHHAEWMDGTGDADAQKIVFANNRTLRLSSRWVSGDPRRGAAGSDLTQGIFSLFKDPDGVAAEPIVDNTFATWNALTCSKLQVNKVTIPPGVFPSAILGLGGGYVNDPFAADISTIGWLPAFIFDAVLGPGASASVLGVTFTFIWAEAPGVPSDIDNDGRSDTALKEVWYNDGFTWSDSGAGIDIETVALHENGHALELGHFGKLTAQFTKKGVRIQASPRAVMNATYIGALRGPLGTDNAAMCGNFASWK